MRVRPSRPLQVCAQITPKQACAAWLGRGPSVRKAAHACFAIVLLALTLLPAPAAAQDAPAPALHITGSGEFTATRDVGPRDPAAKEGDAVVMVEDPRITRRATRIEAQLCRRFGFMFTMENLPPGGAVDLTVTSVHPPILHPSGRISTGVTYDMAVTSEQPGLVGFSFDDPWELVPGTWTFTVRLGDRTLAEQAYEVTASPDPAPAARMNCSAVVS